MKYLGISGGGTKIAGLYGAAEAIMTTKNYKPDIIGGISAGAVLAVPLALGKYSEIYHLITHMNHRTFFNVPPVDKKGRIRVLNALWRIIRGKYSLGEQWALTDRLREVVSESDFVTYCLSQTPDCIVGSVDFYSGARVYVNLKEVTYKDFLLFTLASAAIPIFTSGVELNMGKHSHIRDITGRPLDGHLHLFDGGVRDHSPTAKILDEWGDKITEHATIYSRPQNNIVLNPKDYKPKGILKIMERYIEITNTEVSKNDELLEGNYLRNHPHIKDHGTFFLPSIMQGVYDVDPHRLMTLYNAGRDVVHENWKE